MKKYHVKLQWTKEIDFGVIKADTKSQAAEIAEDILLQNSKLEEREVSQKIIVKRVIK